MVLAWLGLDWIVCDKNRWNGLRMVCPLQESDGARRGGARIVCNKKWRGANRASLNRHICDKINKINKVWRGPGRADMVCSLQEWGREGKGRSGTLTTRAH